MPSLRALPLVLAFALLTACQERVTTTAEEDHLLERLSRDPGMQIAALERDADGFLIVTTIQGNVTAKYVFKPDVAGEKRLNIHRIASATSLDESAGSPPAPLRVR
jgi:YD repeat-containing protein